ncbi:hypothetical protein GUITHDRAFT_112290 [Guillardia theta CCMP2712]|uniref:PTM/DIR17-like Tudor domain-containing protein n=2 Tax=Guillardia theta TaxID=55529 RepID=L1J0A6_GUITC|nr:hypothetical protein GUITHDRAFT_112290 [Guillardia theta CCMP2712]EKX41579.1 hypothetical protein GUITHDRAFT_112290 [Guillardia theta CCMP2712]|eukprot:XP_005828559.1 hypothetical protein GUITHDRAFT_112290 [Guillardia theta CCMP2712]
MEGMQNIAMEYIFDDSNINNDLESQNISDRKEFVALDLHAKKKFYKGSRRYLGKYVVKRFFKKDYLGLVTGVLPGNATEPPLYRIIYHDGDSEDLEENEMRSFLLRKPIKQQHKQFRSNVLHFFNLWSRKHRLSMKMKLAARGQPSSTSFAAPRTVENQDDNTASVHDIIKQSLIESWLSDFSGKGSTASTTMRGSIKKRRESEATGSEAAGAGVALALGDSVDPSQPQDGSGSKTRKETENRESEDTSSPESESSGSNASNPAETQTVSTADSIIKELEGLPCIQHDVMKHGYCFKMPNSLDDGTFVIVYEDEMEDLIRTKKLTMSRQERASHMSNLMSKSDVDERDIEIFKNICLDLAFVAQRRGEGVVCSALKESMPSESAPAGSSFQNRPRTSTVAADPPAGLRGVTEGAEAGKRHPQLPTETSNDQSRLFNVRPEGEMRRNGDEQDTEEEEEGQADQQQVLYSTQPRVMNLRQDEVEEKTKRQNELQQELQERDEEKVEVEMEIVEETYIKEHEHDGTVVQVNVVNRTNDRAESMQTKEAESEQEEDRGEEEEEGDIEDGDSQDEDGNSQDEEKDSQDEEMQAGGNEEEEAGGEEEEEEEEEEETDVQQQHEGQTRLLARQGCVTEMNQRKRRREEISQENGSDEESPLIRRINRPRHSPESMQERWSEQLGMDSSQDNQELPYRSMTLENFIIVVLKKTLKERDLDMITIPERLWRQIQKLCTDELECILQFATAFHEKMIDVSAHQENSVWFKLSQRQGKCRRNARKLSSSRRQGKCRRNAKTLSSSQRQGKCRRNAKTLSSSQRQGKCRRNAKTLSSSQRQGKCRRNAKTLSSSQRQGKCRRNARMQARAQKQFSGQRHVSTLRAAVQLSVLLSVSLVSLKILVTLIHFCQVKSCVGV